MALDSEYTCRLVRLFKNNLLLSPSVRGRWDVFAPSAGGRKQKCIYNYKAHKHSYANSIAALTASPVATSYRRKAAVPHLPVMSKLTAEAKVGSQSVTCIISPYSVPHASSGMWLLE